MAVPDVIRRGFELLSARDLDAWLELFTADARLYDLPELPDSDVYEGREGLRRWAENNLELTEDWDWRLVDVLARKREVTITHVELSVRAVTSDVPVDMDVFHVFETRGEKIAEVRAFAVRAGAFDAAGLEDPGG